MQYTTLGKTGLRVSVAGLGCGGHSQLGLSNGKSEAEAVSLVRAAIDSGINFFDTSEAYVTEPILGRALSAVPRDRAVVCTKSRSRDKAGNVQTPEKVIANLEGSLQRLNLDHVDVFMLHGLLPMHYDYALNEIAPALVREKEKGKIRHIGISEFPARDPQHAMLSRALDHPCWEVMMLGFHMLHQGASSKLLPRAASRGAGTVLMYAVRNIFSRPGALQETLQDLAAKGEVPAHVANDNPLGFLIHEGAASSLTDAAYRFARHEPGANVILFGTSSIPHLHANIESLLKPPLPPTDVQQLRTLFGHLRGVGLDLPDVMRLEASGRPA